MSGDDEIIMDPEGLDNAGCELGGRDGAFGMKATFANVAGSQAMFGTVPNGAAAAAALNIAATALLNGLEASGVSIEGIVADASSAAETAREADAQSSVEQNRALQVETTLGQDAAIAWENRMADQPFHICGPGCVGAH